MSLCYHRPSASLPVPSLMDKLSLLHLLLISAPSPWRFFGWIVGLAVAIVVIIPFTSDAELSAKVGTAAINLAVGIAIYSIVSGVGRSAAQARTF